MVKRVRPRLCNGIKNSMENRVQSWSEDANSRTPKDHLMASLNLMRVATIDVDTVESSQTIPMHNNSCNIPAGPSVVPEATFSIEDASNIWKKPMSTTVTAESNGYSCSIEEFPHGNGSSSHASVPQEKTGRRKIHAPMPRRFIIRHTAKPNASPIANGQQSTFVRIDYNKKFPCSSRGSLIGSPRVHVEGAFPRGHFDCACIKDKVYTCTGVKESDLPQPFVNLGKRCDSKDFKTDILFSASQKFSNVNNLKKGHSPNSDTDKVQLGSRNSSQNGKTMLRFDYNQKSSRFTRESTPSLGNLTYVGPVDPVESMSTCSSSIHSLVDEEALGERLHLSDSESESKDCVPDGVMPLMRNGDRFIVVDSKRFLSLLVDRLNDGGLSCLSCGSKIDGNSVVRQLYNCSSKPPSSDSSHSRRDLPIMWGVGSWRLTEE